LIRPAILAAVCLALGAAAPARAQQDTTRDTTRARVRDTTPPDTVPHFLPSFAPAIPAGPLPLGTRYTFDTDSLRFSDVVTLADLLGRVPGVYVARGGAYGAPEVAFYGARGALGIEVYWDGAPYLPVGRDSLYHDFARIPIAPLERVDVLVLPATLRVYLTTARQHSTVPTSVVRIQTGEFSVADYRGAFARRWRSGLGLALVADWNSINRDPATSTPEFGSVDLWLKGEYVPDARFGISYQILNSAWDRTAIPDVMARWRSKRQDGLLRAFAATRSDGLGFRLDAALLRTRVSRDSAVPDRSGATALLALRHTWPRAGVSLTTSAGAFRPATLELQGGWTPVAPLTLAADARLAGYVGNRSGKRAHLSAGLVLPLGFSLRGDAAWQRDVAAPPFAAGAAQHATDLSGAVRWDRRRWTVELAGVRRDSYQPAGFPVGLLGRDSINALGPVPSSSYLQFSASIRPAPGLTLSGWYFDPVRGGGDFEPPRHGRFSATFYSKFWRVYKSGVFALRAEYAVESWSTGLGGVRQDTLGNAVQVPLAGATFVETNFQIQIVGVTAFWVVRNNNFFRGSYVHGLSYPRRFQYYGVRWVFSN
jgi:TonB-dependent Receptor Plug Domain